MLYCCIFKRVLEILEFTFEQCLELHCCVARGLELVDGCSRHVIPVVSVRPQAHLGRADDLGVTSSLRQLLLRVCVINAVACCCPRSGAVPVCVCGLTDSACLPVQLVVAGVDSWGYCGAAAPMLSSWFCSAELLRLPSARMASVCVQ